MTAGMTREEKEQKRWGDNTLKQIFFFTVDKEDKKIKIKFCDKSHQL